MKNLLLIPLLFLLGACGGEDFGDMSDSELEKVLSSNSTWPYQTVGVLDIVEAGGYEDSDYPDWAVGLIFTDEDDVGVAISIGDGVVSRAGIDIDSGENVRVWLEAPKMEYGLKTYPVSRIEPL